MATAAQVQANRLNAVKSTGPKTVEGKARACRNNTRHGMFTKDVLLPGEDAQAFDQLEQSVLKRLNPRDELELSLVRQIVAAQWRIQRLQATEAQVYEHQQQRMRRRAAQRIERLERQRDELTRQAQQVADAIQRREARHWPADPQLMEQQKETLKQIERIETELSDSDGELSVPRVLAGMMSRRNSAIERLNLYERRLESTMHRCLRELRLLRKEQANQEATELVTAMLKEQGSSIQPLTPTLSPVCRGEGEGCNSKPMSSEDLDEVEDTWQNDSPPTSCRGAVSLLGRGM